MTTTDQHTARSTPARTLRDDLLDDLRQAAPMPATQPAPDMSVPRPLEQLHPPRPETPTLELRVTREPWWGLRTTSAGGEPGFVIGAGPLQISLSGISR
jgi:hypothetical protein